MSNLIKMPDWAKWNVVTDYKAVKKEGIDRVILKAINSANKPDGRFETHIKGCRDADIEVFATYHYSYSTSVTMAVNSAKKWIEIVNGRCKKFILDWEDACLPKGNDNMVAIINAYANTIMSAGYEFYIYAGWSYYKSYMAKYADKLPYKFWVARYYKGYSTFVPKDEPNMNYNPTIPKNHLVGWQYTSSCKINGIQGNNDMSVWYEAINTPIGSKGDNIVNAMVNPYPVPTLLVTSSTIAKEKGYSANKFTSKGETVKWVQWCLYRMGKFVDANGKPDIKQIDGICGNNTVKAIKEVQKQLRLTDDGIVGKQTIALFTKLCS